MKFYPLIFASTISLLTGCGGGGSIPTDSVDTPSDILPETKTTINLMLATSPDDSYFASAQSKDESLALFANSHSQSSMSDALIYNNASDQVSFIRTNDVTRYNRMVINGYQFDYTNTEDGATIVVSTPSGQQETYYVDSDGKLVQESGGNEGTASSGVTSCIARTAESSFCMDLDATFYPESYCTVNGLNAQEGSNSMFTSVNYSTNSVCAERGYPYNLSANNVEGWSSWFAEPVPGSPNYLAPLPTRSLFESNPFDTSACHEQMYDDDTTWSTCINQQITAFTAHAQVGFSEIFRNVVETYYNDLLPAFEKANKYIKSVENESDFSIEAATPKSFITDTIEDLLKLGKSTFQGLNKYFSALEDGTYEVEDPEIEELLGKLWISADSQEIENVGTGADNGTTICRYTQSTDYPEDPVQYLSCDVYDSEGKYISDRSESIVGPDAPRYYSHAYKESYELTLREYQGTSEEIWYFMEATGDLDSAADRAVIRSHMTANTYDFAQFSFDSSGPSPVTRITVKKKKNDIASEDFHCQEWDGGRSYYDWMNNQYISQCPYSMAEDTTEKVHSLGKQEMWLVTGEYQQYLE